MEKDISPFAPWDTSLPLFINDPRYILLSSQKDRREVYEEYCRDVGRQRRLNKTSAVSGAAVKERKANPEKDYKALLREDVTSTRTRWDEWRRKWKKDRRFYGFGRDDREREKLFKQHLKELGESTCPRYHFTRLSKALDPQEQSSLMNTGKRADAQRAETDFFELLSEQPNITSSSLWTEIKKSLSSDPRYDAVGSSTLREELFQSHIRKLASSSTGETAEQAAERKLAERKAKQEASLRERQQAVGIQKEQVEKDVGRSKKGAGREEGERVFGSLLVDQVRDHEVSDGLASAVEGSSVQLAVWQWESQRQSSSAYRDRSAGTKLQGTSNPTLASTIPPSTLMTNAVSLTPTYLASPPNGPAPSTASSRPILRL